MTQYVRGISKLKQDFERIRRDMIHEGSKVMGKTAASYFAKKARELAPEDSGTLKKAIGIKRVSAKGDVNTRYVTMVRKGKRTKYDAWYAPIVEYGSYKKSTWRIPKNPALTKSGNVRANFQFRKRLKFEDGNVRTFVMHPKIKAQPFMRPAFDDNYVLAIMAVERVLGKAIDRKGWAVDATGDEDI